MTSLQCLEMSGDVYCFRAKKRSIRYYSDNDPIEDELYLIFNCIKMSTLSSKKILDTIEIGYCYLVATSFE